MRFGLRDWFSRSIENRIAASSLAVALVTVVLLGSLSYHFSVTLVRDGIQQTVRQEAEVAAARIEATLDHLAKEHAAAAASTLTTNALTDSQGLNAYLIPFLRQSWIVTELGFNIALCDFQGTLISAVSSQGADICRDFPNQSEIIEKNRPGAAILHEGRIITIATPVI
ncbi:MAG: hypothetical protein OEZ08_12620, partial [Betaproteobacteria bacterium]|nr:hypothetical protein [Betaproteobacteria bacterium]